MASSHNARPKPGDEVSDALNLKAGPALLDRDLEALWHLYLMDTSTNLAAFEALERIAIHWWDDDVAVERPDPNFGMAPTRRVEVPWWVVHLLGRCWRNYRTQPGKRVGEALLLEGGGQGKKRHIDQFETKMRNMFLALEVAWRREEAARDGRRLSVEEAVSEVSERFAVSDATVWKAWKDFKDQALKSLNTSRDGS